MHNRGFLVHRLLRLRGKDFNALSLYCAAGSCDQYKLGIYPMALPGYLMLPQAGWHEMRQVRITGSFSMAQALPKPEYRRYAACTRYACFSFIVVSMYQICLFAQYCDSYISNGCLHQLRLFAQVTPVCSHGGRVPRFM